MIKIKKNINLIADLSKMFPPKNRMYDKKKIMIILYQKQWN